MKISGSFITMLIIWLLGFTHFLGGPYIIFKFIFYIALLPFFISILFLIFVLFKAKKILKNSNNVRNSTNYKDQETLYVESTIKEE